MDPEELEAVIMTVRDVVGTSTFRDAPSISRAIANACGFVRMTDSRLGLITRALTEATRRSIIEVRNREIHLACRTIDGYSRDALKDALKRVVGRTWTEQQEAIRNAARYLGFRRTGARIDAAFRSAIRGAIRQGQLERDGEFIRVARR